jgi:hypothetical protein
MFRAMVVLGTKKRKALRGLYEFQTNVGAKARVSDRMKSVHMSIARY